MKRIIPLTPRRWLALEIFRRMKHERVEEHPLRQLFWECTLRCNVRCRHCGSDCKSSPATPDMPLQDFLKVLDSIATHTNPHDVFVIISGGEPTVREDLETCGKEISRRGYPWGMVCNGLCLTRERLHNLIRSGMRSISISLDGLKDVHNWMRRHPESFDCAVNAIREITAIPELTFDVITCVTRRSLPQLPAMKELLISLGVKRWRVSTIFPVGRAAEEPEFRMNGEELKQVLDFIRDTRKEGIIRASYGCEGFLGNYEGEVRNTPFFCSAGISVYSVLIDGSISACSSIRSNYHQGNIYQDDFWEIWQTKFQPYRDRSWMKKDECARCKYFRYCQGNGMHLRDNEGKLLVCHLNRLTGNSANVPE
ncbi:TIGR04133 family radical SAM/SPASM protein [Bacteroides thetaiotaomicron]|nr:TIGR04133 family radical SAM/SPASM protein [Bacteroides thetaiotaomicron]